MRRILLAFAALSVLLTAALSAPLHLETSLANLSQAISGDADLKLTAIDRATTQVRAGSQNFTVSIMYSFDIAFTAMIGSECIRCGPGNYNSKKALEDGYLEYVDNQTSVMEVSEVLKVVEKAYFHGKWAMETLSLKSDDEPEEALQKSEKRKVFIIVKIEHEIGGANMSMTLTVDGFSGLGTNPKQSYAEYLKRRKLIASSTISIENRTEILDINDYKFTYGILNQTALSADLSQELAVSQALSNVIFHSTYSTGLEFDGLDTDFGKIGILGFVFLNDNYYETQDLHKYELLVSKMK